MSVKLSELNFVLLDFLRSRNSPFKLTESNEIELSAARLQITWTKISDFLRLRLFFVILLSSTLIGKIS